MPVTRTAPTAVSAPEVAEVLAARAQALAKDPRAQALFLVGHGPNSAEDYAAWLGEKKAEAAKLAELTSKEWTVDELVARGEKVYLTNCASCHQPTGMGLPPMFPALKGSPIATGDAENHLSVVVHGRPGTAMPAFGPQLSEVDLAAVVTYERNAWGNDKGDMVTPKDVLDFKQAEEASQ